MTTTPTLSVSVKADTSQAVGAFAELKKAVDAVHAPKVGWKTTEFWLSTVAPVVLTALTFIFHRDFSGYVQAAALAATGISTAAYAISRAHLKRPTSVANVIFDVHALLPAIKQAVEDALTVRKALPTTSGDSGNVTVTTKSAKAAPTTPPAAS